MPPFVDDILVAKCFLALGDGFSFVVNLLEPWIWGMDGHHHLRPGASSVGRTAIGDGLARAGTKDRRTAAWPSALERRSLDATEAFEASTSSFNYPEVTTPAQEFKIVVV